MNFTITIVGLGLIGGSLAKALKGFKSAEIYGIDSNSEVCRKAEADKTVCKAFDSDNSILRRSDLTILCLYPSDCVEYAAKNAGLFKDGSLVTDAAGIKGYMHDEMTAALKNAFYLGGHPMAGKEVGGYDNSSADLYKGARYIITPDKNTLPEHVRLMEDLCSHIGCSRMIVTSPHHHDEMIAYTSQLMHVVAVALCDNALMPEAADYSAGSFRDCTRVAVINENLWSELFIENKEQLIKKIEEFESSIDKIKSAIADNDYDSLKAYMRFATKQKTEYLSN